MIIELTSVASVIDDETLLVYPVYSKEGQLFYNKLYADDCATTLVAFEEHFDGHMSKEDKMIIDELKYQHKNLFAKVK